MKQSSFNNFNFRKDNYRSPITLLTNVKNKLKRLHKILLIIAISFFSLGGHAERWKMHPAFDNTPVRIVDTEKYTFFQVLQKLYSTQASTYNEPIAAGLLYDKSDPAKGIFPASEVMNLHAGTIHTCEYSPEGGYLAVLYVDGAVDVVYDNGVVNRNETLKKITLPGWSELGSMTLAGKEIYVTAGDGYAVIDGVSGQGLAAPSLGMKIDRIGRCGENIILLSEGKIYESTTGKVPRLKTELREIELPGSPKNARMLMPRPDGSFMYVADKVSTGTHSVNIAWKKDGKWNNRLISDLWLPVQPGSGTIGNVFEKNFVRNKAGWSFYTDNSISQLYIDRDAENGELMTGCFTKKMDSPETVRSISIGGSWDNTGCWTYYDRGRFSQGVNKNNDFLIDDSSSLRPNLPATSQATHLAYSERYGTLAVNYGCSWIFQAQSNNLPPLLSAYKGGIWSLPNPAYNKPRSAETNADLNNLYNNNFFRFPVSNPNGMSVDPVNGDYVWLSSVFGGLAALNLADPKSDPIHLSAPTDPLAGYPGFHELFEEVTKWRGYNPASEPTFDGEGNLWFAYHYIDGVLSSDDSSARLYCWPKANREKVMKSGDASQIEGIKMFKIPCTESINTNVKSFATSHPDKKNIVFMYVTSSPRWAARLNHGGTLDDPSDDVIEKIEYIEDQHGSRWRIVYWYSMIEEPTTGLVWLADFENLICFDPAAEVKDGVIKGRVLNIESGERGGNILSYTTCHSVALDNENRLWVGTSGRGVFCISADRKKLEAHYTTANSRLPHDDVYGIVWNKDTQSLMISTKEGLCEVWPEGLSNGSFEESISVYPREIKRDFEGNLKVRGISPNTEVTIRDMEGNMVASVVTDSTGTAQWNLNDTTGKRITTGFYKVTGYFGEIEIVVI